MLAERLQQVRGERRGGKHGEHGLALSRTERELVLELCLVDVELCH